ncbi:hypothetical protein AMTRI_Chr04g190280 [Amborella trichopoda]
MPRRNIVTWNAMIMSLAMHGHAEHALQVFDMMQRLGREEPNDVTFLGVLCIVTRNAMIMSLAMHGHAEDALQVFDMTQRLGREEPNDVTFLGVLCACSHGGPPPQYRGGGWQVLG